MIPKENCSPERDLRFYKNNFVNKKSICQLADAFFITLFVSGSISGVLNQNTRLKIKLNLRNWLIFIFTHIELGIMHNVSNPHISLLKCIQSGRHIYSHTARKFIPASEIKEKHSFCGKFKAYLPLNSSHGFLWTSKSRILPDIIIGSRLRDRK